MSPRDDREVLTTEQAVLRLRDDPEFAPAMRNSYLDADVQGAARRFEASGEFAAIRRLVGDVVRGGTVLDLGAGTGIASRAFSKMGARQVLALEPDPSPVIGQGAIARACEDVAGVNVVSGYGESLPIRDGTLDLVYARQVLHHARDLPALVRECARVLRPGGTFLASREHVVDDDAQRAEFLEAHPIHRLAGGENAFSLPAYLSALRGAGFQVIAVLGPWDSVVNAFPCVDSDDEIPTFARRAFVSRFGWAGRLALLLPGGTRWARGWIDGPAPGRLYTFLCRNR